MKYLKLFLACFLVFAITFQLDAQSSRRKKSKEKKEESIPLTERLSADIRMGNIGISSGFSLSFKPGVGYNFNKYLTGGIGSRFFIDYFNNNGFEQTYIDYGAFAFGRAKIKSFYVQGEYAWTKFEQNGSLGRSVLYPVVGLGYLSGSDSKWKYGAEINFPLSSEARFYGPSFEYWINFAYNF